MICCKNANSKSFFAASSILRGSIAERWHASQAFERGMIFYLSTLFHHFDFFNKITFFGSSNFGSKKAEKRKLLKMLRNFWARKMLLGLFWKKSYIYYFNGTSSAWRWYIKNMSVYSTVPKPLKNHFFKFQHHIQWVQIQFVWPWVSPVLTLNARVSDCTRF